MAAVDLVVPGSLDARTGGYIYDRHVLEGLAALGWTTRVHELDPSFPTPTSDALEAARASLETVPDQHALVIDGLALTGLLPLLEEFGNRCPLVALIHHPLADETGVDPARARRLRDMEQAALALVPDVIVTSRWTRRRLAGYGVEPDRITVVEPGVEPATPSAVGTSPTVRMLCVATLTPRKGHAVLFDALSRLADRDWRLRCAGSLTLEPRTADALRAQIDRLGLGHRIELIGERDPSELDAEYTGADLFVLPSYLEGYGMAIAEAVAHGLPVVSTTAGAIPDTIPERAGLLVPPGDPGALALALTDLIDDRARLIALAREAAAARASLPTWRETSERFAAALHRALER